MSAFGGGKTGKAGESGFKGVVFGISRAGGSRGVEGCLWFGDGLGCQADY